MQVLLSTAYFPPIIYFQYLIQSNCVLEGNENFQKQSYRNRCSILSANGIEHLVIPVKHQEKTKISIKEQEISYAENWQIKHWRSIISAYNHAPFFEFYKDDIQAILMSKIPMLFDLNNALLNLITSNLQIKMPTISENWEKLSANFIDKRNEIHPKLNNDLSAETYHQVFNRKFGFTKNLSILDLLFNIGPDAHIFLIQKNKIDSYNLSL
jgi:hypothetical protein